MSVTSSARKDRGERKTCLPLYYGAQRKFDSRLAPEKEYDRPLTGGTPRPKKPLGLRVCEPPLRVEV